jgi:hypothetical protein
LVLGDLDGNGQTNVGDISSLMSALRDLPAFQTSHDLLPNELLAVANVNQDVGVNDLDLQALLCMLANAASPGAGGGSPAASSSSDGSSDATNDNLVVVAAAGDSQPSEALVSPAVSATAALLTTQDTFGSTGGLAATSTSQRPSGNVPINSLRFALPLRADRDSLLSWTPSEGTDLDFIVSMPDRHSESTFVPSGRATPGWLAQLPLPATDEFFGQLEGSEINPFWCQPGSPSDTDGETNVDVLDDTLLDNETFSYVRLL